MFPSQPQIGQDMARERQELAARIRQAYAARPEREQKRLWAALLNRIEAIGKRPLVKLSRRFGIYGGTR